MECDKRTRSSCRRNPALDGGEVIRSATVSTQLTHNDRQLELPCHSHNLANYLRIVVIS